MDFSLTQKKVLITGGTRGIGLAIALQLAQEQARVAVIGRHPPFQNGKPLNRLVFIAADLMKPSGVKKAMQSVCRKLGAPDILINNVGDTLGVNDPYCPVRDWRRVFKINFEIAVQMNEQVIPHMKARQWGRLVHVASNASLENSGPVTYCVTKAALAAYAERLGQTLAPFGIVACSVLPGAILARGNYWDRTSRQRPEHARKYIAERLPLGRFGAPEEIGNLLPLLCSPQAALLSGSQLGMDGGQSKHFFRQV